MPVTPVGYVLQRHPTPQRAAFTSPDGVDLEEQFIIFVQGRPGSLARIGFISQHSAVFSCR
jgi:hypothetical protein